MKTIFDKVSNIKHIIKEVLPETDESELTSQLRVIAKWHYKKKKTILTSEQAKLYELLINKGYNPDTVYKWFLLTRSPFELRDKLKLKLISQKKAFAQKKALNTLASTTNQQLLHDVINCVERYIIR